MVLTMLAVTRDSTALSKANYCKCLHPYVHFTLGYHKVKLRILQNIDKAEIFVIKVFTNTLRYG